MNIALAFALEIIIGGFLSSIWLILVINYFIGNGISELLLYIRLLNETGTIGLFFALIIIYIMGWVSQYFCDLIFDKIQKSFSYMPFKSKSDFGNARTNVFQNCSKVIVDDIQFDRQILKISKHVCFNTAIISIFSLLYIFENIKLVSMISLYMLIMSITSFFHWKKRLSDTFIKFHAANSNITKKTYKRRNFKNI